jgi:hypothetical protein
MTPAAVESVMTDSEIFDISEAGSGPLGAVGNKSSSDAGFAVADK